MFVNVNPQSTLLLGQARGAAIAAAVLADLPVAEYTALQIKQAVVGHGKAAKEQVQEMVRRLLSLRRALRRRRRCAGLRDLPRARRRRPPGLRRTGYRVRRGANSLGSHGSQRQPHYDPWPVQAGGGPCDNAASLPAMRP